MNKTNYIIIILSSLTTLSLTQAMDKPVIDKEELPRLAVNDNVTTIAFLGNTHLLTIVACKKPILIDITTEEKDEKLLYHKEDTWGVKTNSDQTKAVVYGRNALIFYDSQTDKTYTNDSMYSRVPVDFTDIPNVVATAVANCPIVFYNYITKKFTNMYAPFENIIKKHLPINRNSLVARLQQKKIMFCSDKNLYIYSNVNDNPQELEVRTIKLSNEMAASCIYNYDNSLMAFIDREKPRTINILNIESGKKTLLLQLNNRIGIPLMQFHPSGTIFTTVLNESIDYWHTKTSKCFAQQPIVLNTKIFGNYFSFSADGTLLAVAAKEKLEILKVPFETIGTCAYPLGNKDKMPFLLCALKNFQHNNEPLFPEIVKLLVQKTLAVSELTGN